MWIELTVESKMRLELLAKELVHHPARREEPGDVPLRPVVNLYGYAVMLGAVELDAHARKCAVTLIVAGGPERRRRYELPIPEGQSPDPVRAVTRALALLGEELAPPPNTVSAGQPYLGGFDNFDKPV